VRKLLLSLEEVSVYYDKIQVLNNISLNIESNEVVALIGPNGAGKTTIVKTILGSVKPKHGKIIFDGRVIPQLSVIENLKLGAYTKESKERERESLEIVYDLFPILKERKNQKAGTLSGGEQRMLSIGRALMARPKLVIFDELSMGLAPKLVYFIYESLRGVRQQFNVSLFIIEQYVKMALEHSDRAYLLEYGKIVKEGASKELLNDEYLRKVYLGL
jgi:branched-chain amino acid transport system ATP-binding protein